MSSSQVAYLRASTISEAMAGETYCQIQASTWYFGHPKTHLQLGFAYVSVA
jgi:hypothetical protein